MSQKQNASNERLIPGTVDSELKSPFHDGYQLVSTNPLETAAAPTPRSSLETAARSSKVTKSPTTPEVRMSLVGEAVQKIRQYIKSPKKSEDSPPKLKTLSFPQQCMQILRGGSRMQSEGETDPICGGSRSQEHSRNPTSSIKSVAPEENSGTSVRGTVAFQETSVRGTVAFQETPVHGIVAPTSATLVQEVDAFEGTSRSGTDVDSIASGSGVISICGDCDTDSTTGYSDTASMTNLLIASGESFSATN